MEPNVIALNPLHLTNIYTGYNEPCRQTISIMTDESLQFVGLIKHIAWY